MKKLILSLVVGLLVTSNASARICPRNKNFPFVEKGMTLAEVTELIGKPVSAESGPDTSKVLYYCLASSFLDSDGSDTREYWVQTVDGKVIGYGERNDAATMQRAQQQHQAAWNFANSINQSAQNVTNALAPAPATHITVQQQPAYQPPPAASAPATTPQASWRNWNQPNRPVVCRTVENTTVCN